MQDPAHVWKSGAWAHRQVPTEWLEAPQLQSLDEMTAAMLQANRTWPRSVVQRCLQLRANRRSIRNKFSNTGPLLSDLFLDSFPADFLRSKFPFFERKKVGEPLDLIDNLVRSNSGSCPAMALAFTLLFKSTADAMGSLKTLATRRSSDH